MDSNLCKLTSYNILCNNTDVGKIYSIVSDKIH